MAQTLAQITAAKKTAFLEAFAEVGTVTHAARAVGIDRGTPYRWQATDAEFKKAFEEAKGAVADSLEREAIRRAKEGVAEPVFYKGQEVAKVQRYSDTLLIFLLKAWNEKFADRHKIEGGDTPVRIEFGIPRPDDD